MLVAALDGRAIEVRRQWLPWWLRKRKVDVGSNALNVIGGDDLGEIAVAFERGEDPFRGATP